MSWAHGERNEQLCRQLFAQAVYFDWVVTTAFYASLHFVDECIFPWTNDRGRTYNNIDAVVGQFANCGRHGTRALLVGQDHTDISQDYEYLLSNSMTARYKSFKTSAKEAENAIECMENIKAHCE